MRASAIHSLLCLKGWPEHRPERVPLVGSLSDEFFEAVDHSLHEVLFALGLVDRERGIEVDVVATRRRRVLGGGHQSRTGLERERGRAAGNDRAPAEKAYLRARSLLEVAEEGHDVVGAQRLGELTNRGTTEHDHAQPETLPGLDHRV